MTNNLYLKREIRISTGLLHATVHATCVATQKFFQIAAVQQLTTTVYVVLYHQPPALIRILAHGADGQMVHSVYLINEWHYA